MQRMRADYAYGEVPCWKCVMELVQWPFPSMGDRVGIHTVDYLMDRCSSIHKIQDPTFGHLAAFHVIVLGIRITSRAWF